jgi:hypothetical protein
MSKLFEEMAQGTADARACMESERKGYKVTLPTNPVPKSEGAPSTGLEKVTETGATRPPAHK